MLVGVVDEAEMFAAGVAEDEGVHQAAGAGDDGRSAAGAAEDGDAGGFAGGQVDFSSDARGAADDNQRLWRFPEAEDFAFELVGPSGVQEGLVEGDVFGGRRQRQIEELHGSGVFWKCRW